MRLKPLIALASAVTAAAVLLVTLPGCGTGYSNTEVKVLYSNGNPVPGAMVTLMPKDPNVVLTASGLTDESGKCTLETMGKKGVPKGSYKAMVVKLPGGEAAGGDIMDEMKKRMPKGPPAPGANIGTQSLLPAKYGEVGSTPFTVDVPHSGVIELKLDVDGPAK